MNRRLAVAEQQAARAVPRSTWSTRVHYVQGFIAPEGAVFPVFPFPFSFSVAGSLCYTLPRNLRGRYKTMKLTCALIPALAILSSVALCGERGEDRNPPPDPEQQKVREALQRKVTFQFVDTPLQEVVGFFNGLTKINTVLDPKIANKEARINLKVADMTLELALSWVVKLADLEWQIRDQAIYIFDPKQDRRGGADARQERRRDAEARQVDDLRRRPEARQADERQPGREGQMQPMPKISVKKADGTIIEADAPLLMMFPSLRLEVLDHALDMAADGLLSYRLGRDLPPEAAGNIEKIKALLAHTVPGAEAVWEPDLRVLVVTADKPEDLRRAAALMRAFRPEPPPQGFGPREDPDFVVRRKPPQPPDNQPPKPPPENPPGQF